MSPDHEMTELPNYSSTARLIGNKTATPVPFQQPQPSKIQDFLRHARLQLLGVLAGRAFAWRSPIEQRKVALYQSRRMAALNSLFHLIPLGGALALLSLYWTKCWVGMASDSGTTLQFVAKLHELFMQASLVDTLLYMVRVQALNGYVPLGALSGAAHGPQISYLWSLDFMSAITSPAFNRWRKIGFAFSASGLLFMTAVVGPSSAVLMIPRPGMPHVNHTMTRYVNISESALFPTHFDKNSGLNFSRYNDLDKARILESSRGPDHHIAIRLLWASDDASSGHYMRVAQAAVHEYSQVEPSGGNYTVLAMPTLLSSKQLEYHSMAYDSYDSDIAVINASWVVRTLQPVVLAVCTRSFQRAEDIYYFRDDGSKGSLPDATKLWNQLLKVYTSSEITDQVALPPMWIQSPGDSPSLLGLSLEIKPDDDPTLKVCTVSSFWGMAEISLNPTIAGNLIKAGPETGKDAVLAAKSRPITINPEGISSLDAPCASEGSPAILFSENLAACFAATISWVSGHRYDSHGSFFIDNIISGYNRSELNDSAPLTVFQFDQVLTGFGYGSTDTSIKLSLAVTISYCLIVVIYLTYTIATGHTSIAWGSAMELVMLALQSPAPDHLGHISVGIDSMDTFRQSVGIRVRVDSEKNEERLELVFKQDKGFEDRGLKTVELNKAY
ncbi:hypothetical protein M3J09_002512 [Ascochyta lentis]